MWCVSSLPYNARVQCGRYAAMHAVRWTVRFSCIEIHWAVTSAVAYVRVARTPHTARADAPADAESSGHASKPHAMPRQRPEWRASCLFRALSSMRCTARSRNTQRKRPLLRLLVLRNQLRSGRRHAGGVTCGVCPRFRRTRKCGSVVRHTGGRCVQGECARPARELP